MRNQVSCTECPLRQRDGFRDFSEEELTVVTDFKRGELVLEKGAIVLQEGAHNPHLYTVLSGWGFRYKLLSDGRRQIVNFIVPGDIIGLQGTLMGEMQHSVEALSPMVLCVFERARLFGLFERCPELAYDLTWLASREECMLDENLLAVGRRSAIEKVAYLIVHLFKRFVDSGLSTPKATHLSITQQHIADTLGLSIVHTNKTLRKLAHRGLIRWGDGGCRVLDFEGLRDLAQWQDETPTPRPFI